jgi:AraC family transcriptional regulator
MRKFGIAGRKLLCYKESVSVRRRNRGIASHRSTELEHRARINAVAIYIQNHIDEPLRLDALARVAGFSPFHFQRIFAAYVGETLAEYVRRIRLQRAAVELFDSARSVTRIGLAAGYETPSAFTKAFKQCFGVAPSEMRTFSRQSALSIIRGAEPKNQERRMEMEPDIRELPDQEVLYVRRTGLVDNNFNQAADKAFEVLCRFAEEHDLSQHVVQCLAITPDDPGVRPPEECRYDAGFILREGVRVEPDGEVGVQVLEGGRWAVFLHRGPYETMWQTWNAAYRDWLPASGEQLRDVSPYEVYLDDKSKTKPEDLRTEIYIPIE